MTSDSERERGRRRRTDVPGDISSSGMFAANAATNTLTILAPLVVGAAAIPVTIRTLGAERFGVLALVWAMLAAAQTFDFGTTRALVQRTSMAVAGQAPSKVSALFGSALTVQAGLGTLAASLVAAIGPRYLETVAFSTVDIRNDAMAAVAPLSLLLPLVLLSGSFYGVLAGLGRFKTIASVRIPLNSAAFVIPAAGGLLGWSVSDIVWAISATRAVGLAAYLVVVRRHLAFQLQEFVRPEALRSLVRFGSWVALSSVLGPILVYSDRIVVGSVVGAGAVGVYAVSHELVNRSLVLPSAVAAPLLPYLTARWQEGGYERAVQYLSVTFLVLAIPIVGLLSVFAEPIVTLLTGADAEAGARVLEILLIGVGFNAVAQILLTARYAIDEPKGVGLLHLAESLPYVAAMIVLVNLLGIEGAAVAWTGRIVLDWAVLSRLGAGRYTRPVRMTPLARSAAAYAVATVLPVLVGRRLEGAIELPAKAVLVAAGAAYGAAQFRKVGGMKPVFRLFADRRLGRSV
jgi:O-antigen/teichoic acid export membrane protein